MAIREELTKTRQQAWGFFIYRTCYYNNDARWKQFMERLKEFAQKSLLSRWEREPDGEAMLEQLEYNVQQDPLLENCSKVEIWRYEPGPELRDTRE